MTVRADAGERLVQGASLAVRRTHNTRIICGSNFVGMA